MEKPHVCHSCESNPHGEGCPFVEYLVEVEDPRQPPPGSWADIARMMASLDTEGEVDWDAWKDEMKEGDL